jgi:hypothetical protein
MRLPDVLLEGARPHPFGQGLPGPITFCGMPKQVISHGQSLAPSQKSEKACVS